MSAHCIFQVSAIRRYFSSASFAHSGVSCFARGEPGGNTRQCKYGIITVSANRPGTCICNRVPQNFSGFHYQPQPEETSVKFALWFQPIFLFSFGYLILHPLQAQQDWYILHFLHALSINLFSMSKLIKRLAWLGRASSLKALILDVGLARTVAQEYDRNCCRNLILALVSLYAHGWIRRDGFSNMFPGLFSPCRTVQEGTLSFLASTFQNLPEIALYQKDPFQSPK